MRPAEHVDFSHTLLLTVVAGNSIFSDTAQNCNPLLVRVVMLWMAVLGLLLVLAEVCGPSLTTNVHSVPTVPLQAVARIEVFVVHLLVFEIDSLKLIISKLNQNSKYF